MNVKINNNYNDKKKISKYSLLIIQPENTKLVISGGKWIAKWVWFQEKLQANDFIQTTSTQKTNRKHDLAKHRFPKQNKETKHTGKNSGSCIRILFNCHYWLLND